MRGPLPYTLRPSPNWYSKNKSPIIYFTFLEPSSLLLMATRNKKRFFESRLLLAHSAMNLFLRLIRRASQRRKEKNQCRAARELLREIEFQMRQSVPIPRALETGIQLNDHCHLLCYRSIDASPFSVRRRWWVIIVQSMPAHRKSRRR